MLSIKETGPPKEVQYFLVWVFNSYNPFVNQLKVFIKAASPGFQLGPGIYLNAAFIQGNTVTKSIMSAIAGTPRNKATSSNEETKLIALSTTELKVSVSQSA